MNPENGRKSEEDQNVTWRFSNPASGAQPSSDPGSRPIAGEYELADAVLREAIREYQKFARYQSRRGVRLFQDVDHWFFIDDHDSCFSFINVCRILDLEPTYIRTALKMWHKRMSSRQHRYLRA